MKFDLLYFGALFIIIASLIFFFMSNFQWNSFEFVLAITLMLFALHLMDTSDIIDLRNEIKEIKNARHTK